MYHFFDPSLLPVTTTDLEGNILYVRTNGLNHYGYHDIIIEQGGEEAEQLLLDILDRIFSLSFNMNKTWNYNGNLLELETRSDGLAYVIYPKTVEARIISILNPTNGTPTKYKSKGLFELYNHPEVEVSGETIYGKEILGYLMDQVKDGVIYDEDTVITYEEYVYVINHIVDRLGHSIINIQLKNNQDEIPQRARTLKRRSAGHLMLVK